MTWGCFEVNITAYTWMSISNISPTTATKIIYAYIINVICIENGIPGDLKP